LWTTTPASAACSILLAHQGFDTVVATSGERALEILRTEKSA